MDAALNESLRAAEQSVLGAIFIDPDCAGEVMSRVKPADFIEAEYRALFQAARDIQDEGGTLDVVTVLARAGGAYRDLARECMDMTPTTANVLDYCRVLREQAALHRLYELSGRLAVCRDLGSARGLVERMTEELGERTDMLTKTWPELMADFMRRQSGPEPEYIKFGLDFLDSELFIEPGSFVILAARPGVGKTALALQMAFKMAERHRVGYYSLEMRDKAIADRAMASQFGLKMWDIKRHKIPKDDLAGIAQVASKAKIGRLPFEFVEASGKTVADIRQKALARRHEIVIVDYVQLLEASRDLKNPVQELAEISKGLRSLAATGCVVIGLMQLRRPEGGKEYSYPTMNEIKGSGQFEQDADAILLMGLAKEAKNARVLVLDKNREGEGKQSILLDFDGSTQRFRYRSRYKDLLPKQEEKPKKKDGPFRELTGQQEELPF